MNALQNHKTSPRPVRHLQVVHTAPRSQRRVQRQQSYRVVAIEATAKLAVNLLLSTAAIATLIQLLPHITSQQAKLDELRAEVEATEQRVDRLQSDFSRHFDPTQARDIMQEQSTRLDAQKRQILWLDPNRANPAGVAQSH